MPGIDYEQLREQITMTEVLDLIGFEPTSRTGSQLRGPCPVHGSTSRRSRSFSVNTEAKRFYCHKCEANGNHLELWTAKRKLPFHEAMIELCEELKRDIPWVHRW